MSSTNNRQRRQDFVFHARMNARYHQGMEQTCGFFLKFSVFFSLVLSVLVLVNSSGLSLFVSKDFVIWAIYLLAFAVVPTNCAVLGFGLTARMARHREHKLDWMKLLAQAEESDADFVELDREFRRSFDYEPLPLNPIKSAM